MARLPGLSLYLPPLRERREEVPRLFRKFLSECGGDAQGIQASFVEAACTFPWPENVRQVAQAARRSVALFGRAPQLGRAQFPLSCALY